MSQYILSIDQGTTSTRAIIYNEKGQSLASVSQEFTQHYPRSGWVEHDAEEIWQTVTRVVPNTIEQARISATDIVALGVTNQRETVVMWDRSTHQPVARAIVWQDRRTSPFCKSIQEEETWIYKTTGLVIDPYFSSSKIHWLLSQDTELMRRAELGQVACGTIDSWLLWRLTGGAAHVTDVTNASRTQLMNLETGDWDNQLVQFFGIPPALLPKIQSSSSQFGATKGLDFLPDGIPITGVAGDQQAALFGQCGFTSGEAKCTYGTGAFFLQHTGSDLKLSSHRLLASAAATLTSKMEYVIEGSVFIAGAAVQWLRDGLKLFDNAPAIEQMAEASNVDEPILFVPGLVGLGAPHWQPEVRGVMLGLTRATTAADLGRAALEGVAFQIADLVDACEQDCSQPLQSLRADGGMARNDWFLQCQANVLGIPVLQSSVSETTALGAAYLAGLQVGVWPDLETLRQLPRHTKQFDPRWTEEKRRSSMEQWKRAVQMVIEFYREH